MFSSPAYLAKRTGPHGIGRFSFLQSLVTEFQDTDSEDAKLQVLANLANFSYDPINYDYLYQLNVIDLFLDCLSESCDQTVEYSVGGLCNLCLDKRNKEYILKNDGVKLLCKCLSSSVEETVISTIITLMFLVTPDSKTEITSLPVVDAMIRFSRSSNPRLKNVAEVFLQDYCTPVQVMEAEQAQKQWAQQVQTQAEDSLKQIQAKENTVQADKG